MKKVLYHFFILLLFILIFQSTTYAADCSGAKNFLAMVQSGLAKREQTTSITTEYAWLSGWYSMTYDQQYRMISSIAGAEMCIQGRRPMVIITFHGEDVAKADSLRGVQVLKSRP